MLRRLPLECLLLGDENGVTASEYARRVDDLRRPSTPIAAWPHVLLLQAYRELGESLLGPEILKDTEYVRNAQACVAATGHYFGARTDDEILAIAKSFLQWASGAEAPARGPSGSPVGAPVRVRPIRRSDYFQVVDGHHRLAISYMAGHRDALVAVDRKPVWTPLQQVLRDMSWLEGRLELYQPVEAPELRRDWVLVRQCSDRMAKMSDFLADRDLLPPATSTYLDVACCYGWFLAGMGRLGFDARGIERDPLARVIGRSAYSLDPARISVGDCVDLLDGTAQYDVVSCFSLLHHFVLGRASISAERLASLLDAATARVLFLDTGQAHEEWFASELEAWDVDFIKSWLRENTTFREIVTLGPDSDGVGRFSGQYGRMLFACVR
ncbi:MAG: hypothetical protein LC733_07680 [Actinobacteria bacterium]|nr:hypothetical protein [Actinomycetota bacterium]